MSKHYYWGFSNTYGIGTLYEGEVSGTLRRFETERNRDHWVANEDVDESGVIAREPVSGQFARNFMRKQARHWAPDDVLSRHLWPSIASDGREYAIANANMDELWAIYREGVCHLAC